MKSAENVNTEEEQNMHPEESTTSEVSFDVVDISLSCQDPPAQAKLASYPKNHDNRSFTLKWYDGRPWLEYSIKTDTCYCYFGRYFGVLTSSSNKKAQTNAFVQKGFQNWKKALDK